MIRNDVMDELTVRDFLTVNNTNVQLFDVFTVFNKTCSIEDTARYVQAITGCSETEALSVTSEYVDMYTIEDDDDQDNPGNRPYQTGRIKKTNYSYRLGTSPYTTERIQDKPTITCPYCHSTNVEKITMGKKIRKGFFWGVAAASTLTKEWHCKNCKSNF